MGSRYGKERARDAAGRALGERRQRVRLRRRLQMLFAGLLGVGFIPFAPSQAAAQSVRQLSDLDGSNGFRLTGSLIDPAISGAGDVNGDGFADLIIGDKWSAPTGDFNGSAHVVFGKSSGWEASESLLSLNGTNGFRADSPAFTTLFGQCVAGAGDINGDGFDDLIVGAPWVRQNGTVDSGASYVVFGKAAGWNASLSLSLLDGTNGFRLDGLATENEQSGWKVSGGGDVNGDGFADLIVGALSASANGVANSGSSYVVFGKAAGWTATQSLSDLNGINGFRLDGAGAGDQSSYSVSKAGDVNGDGFGDLIVGASQADPEGKMSAGSSYVVFGKGSGWEAQMNLSSLSGLNGFRLDGEKAGHYSGGSVSGAGDMNGDGFDDVIIGARLSDTNGFNSGSSYVVFGKASGWEAVHSLSVLNGSDGFELGGTAPYDRSGYSVSGAGDFNGDGLGDIIVGGARESSPRYVVFGKASGWNALQSLSSINSSNGCRLEGGHGQIVSGAEDVNGDGLSDVMVGGYQDVYVVFAPKDAGASPAKDWQLFL